MNMLNRYRLRVSPWMVSWLFWVAKVVVKWAPQKKVDEFE
jgi:hypothetical protein